jgi:predicted enzyme related to lactoylglutathione lyase
MTSNSASAIQSVICTGDRARLQAFYSELLGAEETGRVPEEGEPFFVVLRIGSSDLVIVADEQGAAVEPGRISLNVFVENVDDLLPTVEPAGGKVLGPPNDMPWGHRVAHVTDPEGNTVNLTQVL